jgi:hypothetical protein
MHLDSRGYLYESYRDGGRVKRRYIGRGQYARDLLWLSNHNDERDNAARQQRRDAIAASGATVAALDAYCVASGALVSEAMTAAGYHRYKRGAWRKRRQSAPKQQTIMSDKTTLAKSATAKPSPKLPEGSHELLGLAYAGDVGAAAQLWKELEGTPEYEIMLECAAPVGGVASGSLIQALAGDNALFKSGYEKQLEKMRDEFAGASPTALELHLAERVALCVLSVARLESVFAQNMTGNVKAWEAIGRQLDRAHRRHLESVKALASIRKAQLPDVQINIGEKQVNIGHLNS